MPLTERYGDWDIADNSYDDPHTLGFDHRINAEGSDFDKAKADSGLAGAQKNVQATCLITVLDPNHGWERSQEGQWTYDPNTVDKSPKLGDQFDRKLSACIQNDKNEVLNAFVDNVRDPSKIVEDPDVVTKIKDLVWPPDGTDSQVETQFVSRFPVDDQYIAGHEYASAYHLGDGYVGTAGHCLVSQLLKNKLHTLKVVFGWSGRVQKKRFASSEVFDIERVVLCDAPGIYENLEDTNSVARWARRWDSAVFQLKGTLEKFKGLEKVDIAATPPRFGALVYNAGHPLGTPMKVSKESHVLRHALFNGSDSPLSHAITAYGSYTTDLDQFGGNSGGPVFDGISGKLVGHTTSTQSAVSEASYDNIRDWENEYLIHSSNYQDIYRAINPYLAAKRPTDMRYRLHPKYYRHLSGKPNGGTLFQNTTLICPGDIGPDKNLATQVSQAVFNRHCWDSPDVVHSNATGRVDRTYLFTQSLESIACEINNMSLIISVVGKAGIFQEPDSSSRIVIKIGCGDWKYQLHTRTLPDVHRAPTGKVVYTYEAELLPAKIAGQIPIECLAAPLGLIAWTKLRLEQPFFNRPDMIGINVIFRRDAFRFPVDPIWPPNRPDITANPDDTDLTWPAEEFHFATIVGDSSSTFQIDNPTSLTIFPSVARTSRQAGSQWEWEAPFDRVWTNPKQLTHGLARGRPDLGLIDPWMSDIDPDLA